MLLQADLLDESQLVLEVGSLELLGETLQAHRAAAFLCKELGALREALLVTAYVTAQLHITSVHVHQAIAALLVIIAEQHAELRLWSQLALLLLCGDQHPCITERHSEMVHAGLDRRMRTPQALRHLLRSHAEDGVVVCVDHCLECLGPQAVSY